MHLEILVCFDFRQLLETFSYLDPDRVGIHGGSYGGFNTATVLAKDQENIFKCGISVAPVTSYFYYGKSHYMPA